MYTSIEVIITFMESRPSVKTCGMSDDPKNQKKTGPPKTRAIGLTLLSNRLHYFGYMLPFIWACHIFFDI